MVVSAAAVAAAHPATVDAAVRTLVAGGSAADAAVTATLAACVAESIFTGLAGGGYATYYEAATGKVTCLDFFCAAPGLDDDRAAAPMRPVTVYFGEIPLPYEIGGASVAVPGVAAGCGEIHARWGRLPWAQVVAPAADLARTGAPMPTEHALTLPALIEAMLLDQGASAYAPGGELLTGGGVLFHAGLAETLDRVAEQGWQLLYTGELGRSMVEVVRADGGSLGPADLASYRVLEREVHRAVLDEHVVLGRHDLNQTVSAIRALPPSLGRMSRPERAVCLAKVLGQSASEGLGDTTNVTVVDAEGNACVVTTTLGLGAGVWLPGGGVHLNSMLGEGELMFGKPAPGARIHSMMCPLVVIDAEGRLCLAIGSAGASRIKSALLTTLIGVFVDDLPVASAVAAPRLHTVDDVVHVEPGIPEPVIEALTDAGYRVNSWSASSHYFGGVSAIGSTGAAGDPRRGGAATIIYPN